MDVSLDHALSDRDRRLADRAKPNWKALLREAIVRFDAQGAAGSGRDVAREERIRALFMEMILSENGK
jgi:hypothetical protein